MDRRGFLLWAPWIVPALAQGQAQPPAPESGEQFSVHPDYERLRPSIVAVLPMDNFSLEPGVEEALYNEVYARLASRGYSKIDRKHVAAIMAKLGVTIPGLIAGFSPKRLGEVLGADALLFGQVEQSASIHRLAYDAVVVSCSLRLVDCRTGVALWRAEQWRAAHRQWALDPMNIMLNLLTHAGASRELRVAYLVQEMLKTLPAGPISVETGNLLERATTVK